MDQAAGFVGVGPFKLVVKRQVEWGVAMRIPGFGGSFIDVTDDQINKVLEGLKAKR